MQRMSLKIKKITLTLLISSGFLYMILYPGCSNVNEDVGPKITNDQEFSQEDLVLNRENHPDGWGRKDCLLCHPLINIPGQESAADFLGKPVVVARATLILIVPKECQRLR